MKSSIDFLVAPFFDDRTRRSNTFLLVVGMLMALFYLVNAVVVYDDLYIPRHFSGLVDKYGRLYATWVVFMGGDLVSEYRTYGFSRLLQFGIWSMFGGKSIVYTLIICISQLATAFFLLAFLRRNRISEAAALIVALIWVISPFAATWTFHHYSYLILPFQILIFTLFVFERIHEYRRKYFIAFCLGVSCALTGEMQLAVAVALFLFYIFRFKLQPTGKAGGVALLAFLVSLLLHRMHWSVFTRANHLAQRFEFRLADQDPDKFALLVKAAFISIYTSFENQTIELLGSNLWIGVTAAVMAIAWFLVCIGKLEMSVGSVERTEVGLAVCLALVGFISITLYIVIALMSGAQVFAMPRRYGFIPLTLISTAVVLMIAEMTNLLSWPYLKNRRIGYAIGLGFFAMLTAQLQIEELPRQRRLEAQVNAEVIKARGPLPIGRESEKMVLLFVASDQKYKQGLGDGSTVGPQNDSLDRLELFESPWGVYWSAKSHLVDFLKFKYVAMTSHCRAEFTSDGRKMIDCGSKWAHPKVENKVEASDVVVIANLGLEPFDPSGRKITVFKTYEEFAPNDFGRRIEKDMLRLASVFSSEFIVDLGQKSPVGAAVNGIFADKLLAAPWSGSIDWMRNYGLSSGSGGIYSHPNIREDLSSYKTNRNGAFSYQFDFSKPLDVEISLDFWEQWARRPGERLFNLDVSWNGMDWAKVDVIDMASINGNKPFSIVLNKTLVSSFKFRLTPVEGTLDVPVIQNVRLRKS